MSVIVRQIQPDDQKQAFKIWSDGMSEDLGEYFFEVTLNNDLER